MLSERLGYKDKEKGVGVREVGVKKAGMRSSRRGEDGDSCFFVLFMCLFLPLYYGGGEGVGFSFHYAFFAYFYCILIIGILVNFVVFDVVIMIICINTSNIVIIFIIIIIIILFSCVSIPCYSSDCVSMVSEQGFRKVRNAFVIYHMALS